MSEATPNYQTWTIKVYDVIGSTGNIYFWTPEFKLGLMEVDVMRGRHASEIAHTDDRVVEDFRMPIMQSFNIDVYEDSTHLKLKLWSTDLETGDLEVIARGGISLDKLRASLPLEKYFVLYLQTKDRGGYVKLGITEYDPGEGDSCCIDDDIDEVGKENIEDLLQWTEDSQTPEDSGPEMPISPTSIPHFDSITATSILQCKIVDREVLSNQVQMDKNANGAGPSEIPRSSQESDFVSERTTAKTSGESQESGAVRRELGVNLESEQTEEKESAGQCGEGVRPHKIIIYTASPPNETVGSGDEGAGHAADSSRSENENQDSNLPERTPDRPHHRGGAAAWIGILAASLAGVGGMLVKHLVIGNGELADQDSESDDDE
ncbi:hypothetical protein BSKO_07833 [Bryopsis sp. KO-2023]|nr:hypothetical protein BSKO_07833 [Bryopsis sp. KO-2023]